MKAMTRHILSPGVARSLSSLLSDEISANARDVRNYVKDWKPYDIDAIQQILSKEQGKVNQLADLRERLDSVKGEEAMRVVYPTAVLHKAADVITIKANTSSLSLIELKYLIKFASKGPFGGCGSFRERISGKFREMERQMIPDGENINPLRVLVVTEEQFPFSVNHIRALMSEDYPPGTFSDDGQAHHYVLCSSSTLPSMLDNPLAFRADVNRCLFFTI